MYRLKNLEKEVFDEFIANNNNHFLQSLSWGELCKIKKHQTPYYLGLIDDNNEVVAATLLLQNYLPLNYSYFYAPRGFSIDYNNDELLKEMSAEIIKFVKRKKGILVKIAPNIIVSEYNYDKDEEKICYEQDEIYNIFKKLGFKINKINIIQPKYELKFSPFEETKVNFTDEMEILNSKYEILETEITIGNKKNIKEFFSILEQSKQKDNELLPDEDYFETLYEIFNGNKYTKAILFFEKMHINKSIKALEKKLKKTIDQISILPIDNLSKSSKEKLQALTEQKNHIKNEIEKYKTYKQKYTSDITLSTYMIVIYKNKGWLLYSAKNNIINEDYINYSIYYNCLKYCQENNITLYKIIDTKNEQMPNNFEVNCIQFIDEVDYIINKPIYFFLKKLIKYK